MISSLLLGMVLSVYTSWFHNIFTLLSRLVLTVFDTWSYHCSLSYFTPVSLHMLKCSWTHTLSCLLMYCSSANTGHADMMYSTVSSNCLQSLHLLSVSVCNMFGTWYLVCNAWSCGAITSLSVSPFRSPLDSLRNMSS